MQSLSVFLNITKIADFWVKNADVTRTQGVCHVIYTFFRSSLGKLYKCAKFYYGRTCLTDFLGRGPFPSIREQPRKGPS